MSRGKVKRPSDEEAGGPSDSDSDEEERPLLERDRNREKVDGLSGHGERESHDDDSSGDDSSVSHYKRELKELISVDRLVAFCNVDCALHYYGFLHKLLQHYTELYHFFFQLLKGEVVNQEIRDLSEKASRNIISSTEKIVEWLSQYKYFLEKDFTQNVFTISRFRWLLKASYSIQNNVEQLENLMHLHIIEERQAPVDERELEFLVTEKSQLSAPLISSFFALCVALLSVCLKAEYNQENLPYFWTQIAVAILGSILAIITVVAAIMKCWFERKKINHKLEKMKGNKDSFLRKYNYVESVLTKTNEINEDYLNRIVPFPAAEEKIVNEETIMGYLLSQVETQVAPNGPPLPASPPEEIIYGAETIITALTGNRRGVRIEAFQMYAGDKADRCVSKLVEIRGNISP